MSKVYVVQEQHRWDQAQSKMVPRFNTVYRARQYGEIVQVLSPMAHPYRPHEITTELHRQLEGIGKLDWIVPIGSPTLVGMCVAVAAHYLEGRVRLLHWSARDEEYVEIKTTLWEA